MDKLPVELKIQVRANKAQGDSRELPWADMDAMPDFASYGDAHQWLVDNKAMELCQYGLEFRIVAKDTPCKYVAALEKNLTPPLTPPQIQRTNLERGTGGGS